MQDYSAPIDCVETAQLIVNRHYRDILECLGFDSFESVWRYSGGKTVKKVPERSVTRIDIEVDGKQRNFYLKRHNSERLGGRRLLEFFTPKRRLSRGREEFQTICDFRKQNLTTVTAVAAGEQREGFLEESFVITEGFDPFVSLENLLKYRAEFRLRMENPTLRKLMLTEVARFARKMHQAGYNHCDFNADHILLHYQDGVDTPRVAIYDLQRVLRRKWSRFRWIIKSLAELGFSLPAEYFDEEDRIHLFLSYKGKRTLSVWDRLQLLWIKKKTDRIRRHTEKHPYHPPEGNESSV